MNLVDIDHTHVFKILAGDRVSLPKDWLVKWKIKRGDLVAIEQEPNSKHLKIFPVIAVPRQQNKTSVVQDG